MFSNEEVREILKVVDAQGYQQFHYDTEDFALILQKQGEGWSSESLIKREARLSNASVLNLTATQAKQVDDSAASGNGVKAPLPGTFYRAPKPGAPAFVEVGDEVEADSVVCIIESMKLMNSVTAGVKGKVSDIRYEDGTFAEKGAILISIEAESP